MCATYPHEVHSADWSSRGGRVHWLSRRNLSASRPRPWSGFPTMSHAIPLRLLQTLNSRRWNCNVCGRCRLFGQPNCMRLLERVRLSCPERARRTREPSPPETESPASGNQRRLVVHHDQARLARGRRRPHAGFQRRAALPAHPVAGQERPAQVVRVDAADRR